MAALKGREEVLASQLQRFAKCTGSLDGLLKRLDRRSAELEAVKQELAKYYGEWISAATVYRREMNTLWGRLDQGDHMVTRLDGVIGSWADKMLEALRSNADAQRTAAEQTTGNLRKLTETGDAFLKRFDAGGKEVVEAFRREWKRTRRWTVPALAVALVLAAPSFAVVGAVGQSEFGVFEPYDDTLGWKRGVWKRHGRQVKACLLEAGETGRPVKCSFDVTYP